MTDRPRTAAANHSVSVVVCAYTEERWDDLVRAVNSLHAQTTEPLEIIVVIDHNDQLARLARSAFPQIRVLANAQAKGLSGARNTGVAAARGDVIAFLDDDAAAVPTWVADLASHYDDPHIYGVGGSATAVWTGGARPKWMPREFDWVVGCSYNGQPTDVTSVRNLVGCNMSFRRQVFDLVGGFRTDIGRVGKRPLGCEETELCIRLSKVVPEARLTYDPAINVSHRVSPDRRRFRYFRSRCYSEGLSKALVVDLVGADDGLESERQYVRSVLPRAFLVGLLQLLALRPLGVGRSFAIAFGLAATGMGYVRGRRVSARRARESPVGDATGVSGRPTLNGRQRRALGLYVVATAGALLLQGLAVTCSRRDHFGLGLALYFVAVVLPFTVGVANVVDPRLPARTRRWILVSLGVTPTVLFRFTDPFTLTGFDEQLHLRTLNDLAHGGPLFSPNPLLPASPDYPGLELFTVAVERCLHLPAMAAITIAVLACRVILVLAIYRLAEVLTGDGRAASLAVIVYAASPQFYLFNSQYAYQTLAVSLAISGALLLSRAVRQERFRWPRICGAISCFAGVTVTHHLTSWIAAGALIAWAVVANRRDRKIIGLVAAAMTAFVMLWAIPFLPLLEGYLGPVFADAAGQVVNLFGGGSQRQFFADSAGTSTPSWERMLLIVYAVGCSAVGAVTGWALVRRALPARKWTVAGLGLMCLAYPLTFAARLAPKASEISDRATTFAFLPLAMGVALLAGRWAQRSRHRRPMTTWRFGIVVVLLGSSGYLGGLVLGSGPDWGRLPGSYLVVADSRSVDPETLAAVAWSRSHLEPGATIMADRVPATLLASTARLWVESGPRTGVEPASLYFSKTWGPEQTRTVQAMHLRYLYVDDRLSESLPHEQWYFYPAENSGERQLSSAGLRKFAVVPGVKQAYHYGPITIYDLQGLGVGSVHHGWLGHWHSRPWLDVPVGLALGGLLTRLFAHHRRVREIMTAWGGIGTASVVVVAVIVSTGLMTAIGFRPGWPFTVCLLLPYLALRVARRGRAVGPGRRPRLRRPAADTVCTAVAAVLLAAAGLALTLDSAWTADFVEVARIVSAVQGSGP